MLLILFVEGVLYSLKTLMMKITKGKNGGVDRGVDNNCLFRTQVEATLSESQQQKSSRKWHLMDPPEKEQKVHVHGCIHLHVHRPHLVWFATHSPTARSEKV